MSKQLAMHLFDQFSGYHSACTEFKLRCLSALIVATPCHVQKLPLFETETACSCLQMFRGPLSPDFIRNLVILHWHL